MSLFENKRKRERQEKEKKETRAAYAQLFKDLAETRATRPTVVTCPQGVVTFVVKADDPAAAASNFVKHLGAIGEMLQTGESPQIRNIKEILAANPRANLKLFEDVLGVTFIDIQLTSSRDPGGDIYV